MNSAAWQPLRGAPEPGFAPVARRRRQELTPVRRDWISAVPLAMPAIALLAAPKPAVALACGGWGEHLLDLNNIRLIESEDFR
jgi:hypothetical protein